MMVAERRIASLSFIVCSCLVVILVLSWEFNIHNLKRKSKVVKDSWQIGPASGSWQIGPAPWHFLLLRVLKFQIAVKRNKKCQQLKRQILCENQKAQQDQRLYLRKRRMAMGPPVRTDQSLQHLFNSLEMMTHKFHHHHLQMHKHYCFKQCSSKQQH